MKRARNSFLEATSERADLNQYWFSRDTVETLAAEASEAGGPGAFVSSPSVYFSLPEELRRRSKILDFDEQWASDPGFVFYDFRKPESLPPELQGTFSFVLVDPPFITREVWEMYATTVQLLARPDARVLCTTIAENEGLMWEILGLRPALFRPSIPSLVYQYSVYVNYASDRLSRLNPEVDHEDWREAAVQASAEALSSTKWPVQEAQSKPVPAGIGDSAAIVKEPLSPPSAALLVDLREQLVMLKRTLEAMQAPLYTAVRRRAVGGQAATAAAAKARVALDAAEASWQRLDQWILDHGVEAAAALGELCTEVPMAGASPAAALLEKWHIRDRWQLQAIGSLLTRARNGLSDLAACQEFALACRQKSAALFRQAGLVLDRIKDLQRAATP